MMKVEMCDMSVLLKTAKREREFHIGKILFPDTDTGNVDKEPADFFRAERSI